MPAIQIFLQDPLSPLFLPIFYFAGSQDMQCNQVTQSTEMNGCIFYLQVFACVYLISKTLSFSDCLCMCHRHFRFLNSISKSSLPPIYCLQESPVWGDSVGKGEALFRWKVCNKGNTAPKVRYPETKGRPTYTEEVLAMVPDFIHFYANEVSKFAQVDWSPKHCHDWLESRLWIGNY